MNREDFDDDLRDAVAMLRAWRSGDELGIRVIARNANSTALGCSLTELASMLVDFAAKHSGQTAEEVIDHMVATYWDMA